MILGRFINSSLEVLLHWKSSEEVYKEDLCEPGEVFFKLAHIERSVLGMRAKALSKTVLAFHLIRSSNFPYGICSYQISSNTITVQMIHGKDVHTLFRVKFDDIITEELSQIDSCLLVVKKSTPAMRVIMLRDTWEKVAHISTSGVVRDKWIRTIASG